MIVRGQFSITGTFWRVNEAGHLVDQSPVVYPLTFLDLPEIEKALEQISVDHRNLQAQANWANQLRAAQEKEKEKEVDTAAEFAEAVKRGDAAEFSSTDTYESTPDGLKRVEAAD